MEDKFRQIRDRNTLELNRRFEQVREIPMVAELLSAKEELIRGNKFAFASEQAFTSYQNTLREIDEKLQNALEQNGFPKDYLKPIFDCAICRDTGFVVDERGLSSRCVCNQKNSRFADFEELRLDVFDDKTDSKYGMSQRENMQKIISFGKEYAESFPQTGKHNLLFCGGTGLGKSYLAGAMAKRIGGRGFDTCVVNSYALMEQFKDKHINGTPFKDAIYEVDFLVIDDLGTEPLYNNITIEYLFALLNERIETRRHTLIVTNLPFDECKARYGERVASRLYDSGNTQRISFFGRDLRLQK